MLPEGGGGRGDIGSSDSSVSLYVTVISGGGWNSKCGGVRRGGGDPGEGLWIVRMGTCKDGGAGEGEDISRSESWLCVKLGLGESVTCVDGVGVSVLVFAGWRSWKTKEFLTYRGDYDYNI